MRALRRSLAAPTPGQKVVGLSVLLAAIGAAGASAASSLNLSLRPPFHLSWWAFAPAILAAELLIFHIERQQETHSFNLSELPLVVGFFFAPPWAVLVGRLLGHLVYRGAVKRQAPLKLLLNLSSFAAETGLAIFVFRSLDGGRGPLAPLTWAFVGLAVVTADCVGMAAVTMAIRWHGAATRLGPVIVTGVMTAGVNTGLSVLAAILLWVSPASLAVLVAVVVVVSFLFRRHAALAQRYSSLQMLYSFTRMVGASLRLERITDEVLAEARKLMRAAVAEIVLLDDEAGRMHRLRSVDSDDPDVDAEPASSLAEVTAEAVWKTVVNEQKTVVISRSSNVPEHVAFRNAAHVVDCVVAPLVADGNVVGTIMVADRVSNVTTFDDEDLQLFATLAAHVSVAFENGRLVERLRREANDRRREALHDSLTGLPNRAMFLQRVADFTERRDRRRGQAAVMLMDLDRFKEINDTLGHHNGDLLLRQVGTRLLNTLRRSDTVARLGGDEFAILLTDILDPEEALDTAHRVVEVLEEPFVLEGLSVDVGASVGVALFPAHGDDAAALLQRADVAMYEAKGSGISVSLYSPDRDHNTPRRLTLAAELRQAITNGEIRLVHQPKARLRDGQIVGTEALARWQHPTLGVLGPVEFIPIAEQCGLINALTFMVLRSALDDCRRWNDEGHDVGVAVNLAVRCLVDIDFPRQVEALLVEAGVPSSKLTLEITESGVMADPARAIAVLERLAALGVRLSVDDFGTGYSSLSYLRRLPVHEVKIDQSFVRRAGTEPNDTAILQSIIELGSHLGLSTVAEGVEDRSTWDLLRNMGCEQAQGYLLARPMPASELVAWLDEHRLVAMAEPALSQPGARRILIVDDDPTLRGVIRAVLGDDESYSIHEASDGIEAIVLARTLQPDVILLDLCMPRMNGVEALPTLKSVAPATQVLVLSASQDRRMVADAAEKGAAGFIDKAEDLLGLPHHLTLALAS